MSYAGPDVARLLGCVATARPESLILVPELLRLLVMAAERGWPVPPTLKFVAVGGALRRGATCSSGRGRRAAGVRRLWPQRVRVGGLPQHARVAAAAAASDVHCRTRACASRTTAR